MNGRDDAITEVESWLTCAWVMSSWQKAQAVLSLESLTCGTGHIVLAEEQGCAQP